VTTELAMFTCPKCTATQIVSSIGNCVVLQISTYFITKDIIHTGRLCKRKRMTTFSQGPHRAWNGTGFNLGRANSSQQLGEIKISRELGPGNSCKEGIQTKQKDHRCPSTPTCAQFLILLYVFVSFRMYLHMYYSNL
jgi:hypothetical protein